MMEKRDALFTTSMDAFNVNMDMDLDMEIVVDNVLFPELGDAPYPFLSSDVTSTLVADSTVSSRNKRSTGNSSRHYSDDGTDESLNAASSADSGQGRVLKRKLQECDEQQEQPLPLPPSNSNVVIVPRSIQLTCTLAQYDQYMKQIQKVRSLTEKQLSELRAQRKKVRNREYAKNKRASKKSRESSLREEMESLREENQQLKSRVAVLEKENASLRSQFQQPPFSLFIVLLAVGLSFSFIGLPALNSSGASQLISTGRALLWNWDTVDASSVQASCANAVNVTACIEALTV